jgi:hypothetical protein
VSDRHDAMADAFDRHLLCMVQAGKKHALDAEGNIVEAPLTAADLNVVRQRLKDCGITSLATPNSVVGSIVEAMRERQLKIEDMDADEPAFGT